MVLAVLHALKKRFMYFYVFCYKYTSNLKCKYLLIQNPDFISLNYQVPMMFHWLMIYFLVDKMGMEVKNKHYVRI
jgi:hypothetical protein